MKGPIFTKTRFILAWLCLLAVQAIGQINPTTQIRAVSPPAADNLLMTRVSDGRLEYKTLNYLIGLLPDEVVQGTTAPGGAPSGMQGNVYLNTATGQLYVWNGTNWVAQDGEDEIAQGSGAPSLQPGANQGLLYVDTATGTLYAWNGSAWISYALNSFENALTKSGAIVHWGGDLMQNTLINGKSAYSVTFDSTSSLTLRARTTDGSGSGVLGLSKFESTGAFATYSRASNPVESSQWSLKPDAAYIRTQNTGIRGEVLTTDYSAQMAYVVGENSLNGAFYVDSTGHYLLQLQDKTAAETQMLFINPTTFEVSKGPTPVGSSISTYTPSTSGSGSLTVVVTATGAGITAVRGSGTLTVTIPAGVSLLSAHVTGDDAENDGSGNLTVTFDGPGLAGNESIATLHIPATQKIDLSAQVFGAPAPGNPYAVDDDDTVQMQVVGVGSSGSPSISIRAVGLTVNYDDYQLVFNF
ncbi:MAG: hypothetical protein KDD14_19660 [Saprospiraceae bacterium]|nr:hypothetical protein [Saprospiraceae bacterium]